MSGKPKKNNMIQTKIKIWPVLNAGYVINKKVPEMSEKNFTLPEISNPLLRLKEMLESEHLGSISRINKSQYNTQLFRARRISLIDDVIKTCEKEKSTKNLLLVSEINRSENQLQNVVKSLDHFKKREKNINKRRRENEFYMTRVEMKKMIDELRVFTKHIG